MENKIRVGVSSCLLGNPVRYDGGHKHDRYITDILGTYFDFIPVCPEVECGLPVPRETMRLVGDPEKPFCRRPEAVLTIRPGCSRSVKRKLKNLQPMISALLSSKRIRPVQGCTK
jgi:uncharacterized protein YbbK (DUF523 family)